MQENFLKKLLTKDILRDMMYLVKRILRKVMYYTKGGILWIFN